MQRIETYAFASPLALPEMAERLNALGKYEWGFGDSAWHGDYLRVWPPFRGGGEWIRLRIYEGEAEALPLPFALQLIFESEAPGADEAWQALYDHVRCEVLPALDARDIKPIAVID